MLAETQLRDEDGSFCHCSSIEREMEEREKGREEGSALSDPSESESVSEDSEDSDNDNNETETENEEPRNSGRGHESGPWMNPSYRGSSDSEGSDSESRRAKGRPVDKGGSL